MEVAKKLAINTECFYFPLDFSWAVKRVFSALRPQVLVLGELELWPNLIDIAERYDVPLVVVNGRLSQRSFRGYQRFSWFTKPMFRKLRQVAAQSEEYAERFRRCGCPTERVAVTGNLKFDNVAFDAEHEQVGQLRNLIGIVPPSVDGEFAPDSNCLPEAEAGKRVAKFSLLVLGSSQEPEERATVDAFMQLRKSHEQLKLIVVPRHPDRFSTVGMWLEGIPFRVQRRSALTNRISADSWDILLVDTVGELRWWWGLADIAIVGGSFGDRGGQNMIEPAAYGANVAFGPNTSNFRDVTELLLQANAATRLQSTEAILPWLRSELSKPELGEQRGQLARELIASQQGATRRTIQVLRTVLPPAHSGRQSAA
jgi:3-deoxy-D-manno-octulosonic-acid transferase